MKMGSKMTGKVSKTTSVVAGWIVVSLLAGIGVGWALRTLFIPPIDPQAADTHTYVQVTSGEVGSSVQVNAAAQWTTTPQGVNQASGIVTQVFVGNGDEVSTGAKLYSVDLRPVSLAHGTVPAFRDLDPLTSGEDVAQLQGMLTTLGLFSGETDGVWRPALTVSVKEWQKSLGVRQTGVVLRSDLIFVPTLPSRVSLDHDKLRTGVPVSGGEEAVHVLPNTPRFWLPLSDGQASGIMSGMDVRLTSPSGDTWRAVTGARETDPTTNTVNIVIEPSAKANICASDCGDIELGPQTLLPASIELVMPVTGLVVPTTALVSTPDGVINVITPEGKLIPVTVVGSAKGQSVIEGVAEGAKVQVPARLPSTKPATP